MRAFFADGTHVIDIGVQQGPFRLTFTNPVGSVQLDAQSDTQDAETQTLNAYDSSGTLVASDAVTAASDGSLTSLSVSSATNNINYFTIETTDQRGLGFGNVVWGCA